MKNKTSKPTSNMKTSNNGSSFKKIAASALLAMGLVSSSQGVNIALSGSATGQAGNQPIIDFLTSNFQNVTVTYGDFSNPLNIPAGTDLFMVGRIMGSGAYANAGNSATFNSLTIPVVSFTSFVTRPDSSRWGWHSGGIGPNSSLVGNETTVTAAGAGLFGVAAGTTVDWFTEGGSDAFSATGTGMVGGGEILATLGGNIFVAHWDAGDLSGSGVAFGGERLLFNLSDYVTTGTVTMPSAAGQLALISALEAYTPLIAVPEPASSIFALAGVGMLLMRRQRR